jgi:hypothetical protein
VGAKASLPLARLTASFWERRLPPIRISDEWIASQSDVGDALPGSWIPSSLIPHGRGRPAPPSKALLGLMRRAHRIEGHVAGLQRKHGAPAHTAHVEPRAVAGAEDATYVRMRST